MYQYVTSDIDNRPLETKLISFFYRGVVKNTIDSVTSFLAIILFSPLLLLIAIRIKLESPGPIIIRQKCEGHGGHPFKMYKFRTYQLVQVGPVNIPKYVRRETYIGTILKETNLEKLPQLFNVFMSDMSLVGPRPEPCELMIDNLGVDQVVLDYRSRTRVKPGMTGWARINGSRGPLRSFDLNIQNMRVSRSTFIFCAKRCSY